MNVTRIEPCITAARQAARRPTFNEVLCAARARVAEASDSSACHAQPPEQAFYIQPPWRMLPWPTTTGPVIRHAAVAVAAVKAPVGTADVSSVGRTLDLFV